MIAGQTPTAIMESVAAEFGVSTRVVGGDLALVRRKWAREDTKHVQERRSRTLRRLELLATRAEAAGEFGIALACLATVARCCGLILPPSVMVAQHQTMIAENRSPQTLIDLVKKCAEEEERERAEAQRARQGGARQVPGA